MLQVGSISNFFNTAFSNHLHSTTAISVLNYKSNNTELCFVAPSKHFDILNNYASGYKRVNKLQPLIFLNLQKFLTRKLLPRKAIYAHCRIKEDIR